MTVRLKIIKDSDSVMFTSWWDNLYIYYDTTQGKCWTQVTRDLEQEWHARIIYQDVELAHFGSSRGIEALEFDNDEDATQFLLRWS